MNYLTWLTFILAAVLEVGGDVAIRHGLRGSSWMFIAAGFLILGAYGLIVNLVPWDFSKLLGVYVAFFAVISILSGRFIFHENIPPSTWAGLGLIVIGGLVIQFGSRA